MRVIQSGTKCSEDVLLSKAKNLGSITLCIIEILPPFGRLDDKFV